MTGDKETWNYTRTPLGRSGRSLAENNFARDREKLTILIREALQNALDAPLGDGPVRVRIAKRALDADGEQLVDSIFDEQHLERFKVSVPHVDQKIDPVKEVLLIEDFGTTGLLGQFDNLNAEGPNENWNAFWFREGEGGKEDSHGNGGAGQGKITYFSAGRRRTIFAVTIRPGQAQPLLFGASSFLRDYVYSGGRWLRDAYWGITRDEAGGERIALPSTSTEMLDRFRSGLGITRKKGEPGLSIAIPSPIDFEESEAIEVTIAEFFIPILRGDLIVEFESVVLDSSSIQEEADARLPDERARTLKTSMTRGFRAFASDLLERSVKDDFDVRLRIDKAADINESAIPSEALAALRERFDSGAIVSARFEIQIRRIKTSEPIICNFEIHLTKPDELDQTEQATLRRDLVIGDEPIGRGRVHHRIRGLTLIRDKELSRLLLSAEEATHLRWNAKLPRLGERYVRGQDAIAVVRNALSQLLQVIEGGQNKRDFRSLAKYFPVSAGKKVAKNKTGGSKRGDKGPTLPDDDPPPPPVVRSIKLVALVDGCAVRPNPSAPPKPEEMPIRAELVVAYEGLDKDAFSEYDPFDFDLADAAFSVTLVNCRVESQALNRISFVVDDPEFCLIVRGFDPHLRLRARLKYEEARDAANIDAE